MNYLTFQEAATIINNRANQTTQELINAFWFFKKHIFTVAIGTEEYKKVANYYQTAAAAIILQIEESNKFYNFYKKVAEAEYVTNNFGKKLYLNIKKD